MPTKEECELALKEILSLASPCSLEVHDHRSSYLKERYELLEQLIKVHFDSKWIPVEERLPENAGYSCLATIENKFGQITVAKVFTSYGDFGDSFWLCNEKDINLKVWKVIAWMPLPKPYRKEDEE